MDIKEITVSRSVKIDLGNYESLDMFVSARAELDPLEESEDEAFAELSRTVERALVTQLYRSYTVRGVTPGLKKGELTTTGVAKHHGLTQAPKPNG